MKTKVYRGYQCDDFDEKFSYISQNIGTDTNANFIFLESPIIPLFVIEYKKECTIIYYLCTLQELCKYMDKYLLADYCPSCRKIILKEVNKIELVFVN